MEINISERNSVAVFSIAGKIDVKTVTKFSTALSETAYRYSKVVVEMREVNYLSSASIQILLTVLKICHVRGGDLCLANVQPNVQRLLRVSGFLSIVQLYDDVDAAVASFAGKE